MTEEIRKAIEERTRQLLGNTQNLAKPRPVVQEVVEPKPETKLEDKKVVKLKIKKK